MKKGFVIIILCMIFNNISKGQEMMSTYNLSKNELNSLELYENEYRSHRYDDYEHRQKKGRFMRVVAYSGLLIGGLVIAEQAANQDYYMNNSTIYGLGGVMTILATGLVISSVNGINKELYFSVKKEGLTMNLAIR